MKGAALKPWRFSEALLTLFNDKQIIIAIAM